jgi:PIN domain nuclease of toxin-antitoxin system
LEDHSDEAIEKMILLDTHALIWLANDPDKLSRGASEAIHSARQSDGLAISAITLWEVAWLATHGRFDFVGTADALIERISSKIAIRPITPKIAVLANQFPATYSKDPSDRLIVATAMAEGIALVTKDRNIRDCKQNRTIW